MTMTMTVTTAVTMAMSAEPLDLDQLNVDRDDPSCFAHIISEIMASMVVK